MNINDVLIRVLKKDKQTSEQILHRNEAEEENLKHAPEVIDREYARKLPEDKHSLETIAPESSRDREMIAEKSDELKKIEKEIKDQKSELERLQVATREREEANRLMEEEIGAQLRELEDNRQSNKIQARSSGKKSFRHEVEDEEEDAELELRKFEVRLSSVKLSRNIFGRYPCLASISHEYQRHSHTGSEEGRTDFTANTTLE